LRRSLLLIRAFIPTGISISRFAFLLMSFRRCALTAVAGMGLLSGTPAVTQAAPVTIVALGTSNTYGQGVARNEAYPAQLQAQLKSRGIDARVINAGVNGDTTKGMLLRLNGAVPSGAKLVLIEVYPKNEARGGVADQTSANLAAIKGRIQARGIAYIDVSDAMVGTIFSRAPHLANRHLAPGGYEIFVSRILAQVVSALGR
jgi:acyl-CoA thioesterase-1